MVTDRSCVWAPNRYSPLRSRLPLVRTRSVIPKELAPDFIRGGNRFSERIMLKQKNLDHEPIRLNWSAG
jgi:hypothetical protein